MLKPTENLQAQALQTLHFHAPVERIPLTLQTGVNYIRVEGLQAGKLHSFIPVGAAMGQNNSFETHFVEPILENKAFGLTPSDRPQWRRCYAPSETVDLIVEVAGDAFPSGVSAVLSVNCEECEHDDTWRKKFDAKVESILANISVTPGVSASSLITNTLIGGDCFDVANITSTGNTNSRGTFANGTTSIGIANGAELCSGHVNITPGPNNSQSANNGFNNNSADDPDLATLTTGNQYDVSKIEFDFTPTSNMVQFDFVFASEEYCEYVNTQYNDVFGFFITGPGISGVQNLAVIPTTTTPITINSVNHLTNSSYYVNNNTWNPCQGLSAYAPNDNQFDGWTTVLTAVAAVDSCETYHIKLAIADVADAAYASAVFLKANSFNAGGSAKADPIYPSGQTYIYEDCGTGGFIRFSRIGGDLSLPYSISYTVDPNSTATWGVDYAALPNPIIIPAGQTYIDIPITAFQDFLVEGNESIILTISSSCSCDGTEVEFVIADKPPLEVSLEDELICGGTSVTLSPDITGGLSPFTYHWSNGPTTPTITINTNGTNTYTVTVTDKCGTTATASSTVTIQPQPTANLAGTGFFCAGVPTTVNLTLTLTGIGPWDVTYSVAGNTVTETYNSSPVIIPATEPGAYTLVSVESSNGCTGTVTGNVNLTEYDVEVDLTTSDPLCNASNNGTIQTAVSGGGTPYVYSWSNAASTPNLNNLPPGTYTVTVTDSHGCTETAEETLTAPPPLTATAIPTTGIDCNNPTGNADLTVEGGTPGYDYNWSNGSNQEDPDFTAGGTFTVTVTDDNNCTTTATVTIASNLTQPVAVATFTGQITCVNTFVEINGNGSSTGPQFTYEWSGPSFLCCDNTLFPQVDQGGSYTLTVTNTDNGCTKTVTVTIPENTTPPVANINTPGQIGCNTPTLTLNGAGTTTGAGIVYTWSTFDGNFTCCTNTLFPQINQAGTYTLSVVNNNNGCTDEMSVTIEGNTIPPVAVAAPPVTVTCYDPEITIDGTGSSEGPEFTYQWTSPNGTITGGGNTLNPTVNEGGTYTLVVTNTDNNCTATVTVTVPENTTPPIAVANAIGAITCQTPSITINGTGSSTGGAFGYQWTTFDGNILSGDDSLYPVVNAGGTYTLVVTNGLNGCTAEDEVIVPENNDIPTADAGPDLELNCFTPTVQINGTASTGPGYTLQWQASPGNILSGGNTPAPTVNQPGTYILTVTNTSNGCTQEDVVEVTENFNTPTALINPAGVLDCYNETIDLDAGNSTQGSNIEYQWSTVNGNIVSGDDTPFPTVDDPGTYYLTVTDTESGCTATSSVTVTQNITPPVSQAGLGFEIDCQHLSGYLNGAGSSSGSNFTYLWETYDGNIVGGETTLTPEVDAAGTYYLVVTNVTNGCTAQDYVVVTADQDLPVADGGPDLELNCANMTVQLDGTASSFGNGLQISWVALGGHIVSGANTLTPTVDETGIYELTITNPLNGCVATDEVFVDFNIYYPTAIIETPNLLSCAYSSVQIDANQSSQGAEFSYVWTTPNGNIVYGENTPYPEVDEPGTYNLLITNDNNFCTTTATITVGIDTLHPVAVAATQGSLTCQFPQTTLSGAGSSSGFQFFYQWTTGNGNIIDGELTLNPTVNQPGTYLLTVFNIENGCESTASTNVITSQQFPVANAGPVQTLTCTAAQISLDGSGSSQGNQYAYIWTTQNGNIVSGANTQTPVVNMPGIYDLAIVNTVNGCTATASVNVNINTVVPTAATLPGDTLSCTVTSVTLSGTGSSTGSNFGYVWSTSNGNIISGDSTLSPVVNAVGDYNLIVTNLVNGCTAVATTNVPADASVPTASAGPNDTINCYVSQLTLNGVNSSQGAQYSYDWTGPGIVNGNGTLSPLIDQAGTYTLQVTNTVNGCTANDVVLVVPDVQPPQAEAGPANIINCYNPTLMLDGTGSSTGAQITYAWSTANGHFISGANTLSPVIDQPGDYGLLVTNLANGCVSSDAVNIGIDTNLPLGNAGPDGLITCTNPTVTLAGTGSAGAQFTYLWTTPNGNISTGDNTFNPVVDAPGTYTLLVTNIQNGCTVTDVAVVNKDANVPVATASVPGELNCLTSQLSINGTGSTTGAGVIYQWSTSNGNIVSGENTLNPVVDEPGQYTLSVFNSNNNCTALFTADVVLNTVPPVASAGLPGVISCLSPVMTLNGSQSSQGTQFTYLWTTLAGNILTGANSLSPTVDAAGFYELLVTDTNNGCTSVSTVQILLDQNTPVANAGQPQVLTCAVTSLLLNGNASSAGSFFSYQWSTLNGHIVSGNSGLTPLIDEPGVYTLLVHNNLNGCDAQSDVLVTEDLVAPVADAGPVSTLTCAVTSLSLDGSGSSTGSQYVYAWTTLNGQILSGANTINPMVGDPGVYTILVTNQVNGCTQTANVTIPEDVVAPASAAATLGELTCSITSVALDGTGSSTGPVFQYGWNGPNVISGVNTLAPVVGSPGAYTLLVTNGNNGCTSTASVTVPQNIQAPFVDAISNAPITCAVTQLSLSANAAGGVNGISYSWTASNGGNILSGGNTASPLVNAGGTYTLTVTDLYNGCTSSDAAIVATDLVNPTPVIATPGLLTCAVLTTTLDGNASSTGPQYSYSWTGPGLVTGSATLMPSVNAPGIYTLQITNNVNGCTASAQTTVPQDVQLPTAEAGTGFELTCTVFEGLLNGTGTVTGPNYGYLWTTADGHIVSGQTTLTPLVNHTGSYALQVTNLQTGCVATDQVVVTRNTNVPTGLTLAADPPACGGQTGTIAFEAVQGGVGPYLYSIDGGNSYLSLVEFDGLVPGTYKLMVQDINGCEYEQSLVFPVPVEPAITVVPEITLAFGASDKVQAQINIPLGQVDSIIWSPMEGITLTNKWNEVIVMPFQTTQYEVLLINKDGCEDRATLIVRVEDPAVWAPNVINPYHQDGRNDYFCLFAKTNTVKIIHSLQIYDRWGNQVFYTTDIQPNAPNLGWDGMYRGQPMNPAVFVWWAEVELINGQKILMKGDVTIVD